MQVGNWEKSAPGNKAAVTSVRTEGQSLKCCDTLSLFTEALWKRGAIVSPAEC